MDLTDYVEALRGALTTAAAAGSEQSRETARLLADTMEPAVRLALIDAMSALAAEVTAALDGDVVDVRVRGGDPEVVVVPAAHEPPAPHPAPPATDEPADDGAVARISLRLPDALKARAEAAATAEGGSLNAWLVRAVADALDRPRTAVPSGRGPRRYSGFARS
jgi:HicB family